MNNVGIQKALQEMQALAKQAQSQSTQPAEKTGQADFSSMLQQAVNNVNELQQTAGNMSEAFVRGEDVQLTDVVIAGQKSRVAFTAMKEVRNNLLEAYREISRMQV